MTPRKPRPREGETKAASKGQVVENTPYDTVIELLATGEPLRQICRREGMPSPWAVLRLVAKDESFAQRYAHARSIGCEVIADEIMEISDDGRNDWMEREGIEVTNQENIQRSRLRVDSRKWLLSKLKPEKYSDSAKLAISGPDGGPVQIAHMKLEALTDDELTVALDLQRKLTGAA
jgi:hypothetical protein